MPKAKHLPSMIGGLFSLSVLALGPSSAAAAPSQTFDGVWTVEVDCADVGDVRGYNWRFPVEVRSGILTGTYRSSNSAMGDLRGRVGPDGRGLLTLVGRTGPTDYSVGHVGPGTPFRYTANVKFQANSGFGKRNELRPCTLTFSR